jgi:carbon storage regulator
MLVLSRQRDETIMIGDDIEITIVDIRGDKVRIGINAPRQIQVHRKEVYDAIKRENEQAAKLKPCDVSDVVERDAEENRPEKKSRDAVRKYSGKNARDAEDLEPNQRSGEGKKVADSQSTSDGGQAARPQ